MITGAHFLRHSTDPEQDRAFFRNVLDFPSVDAGHGWLIFGLPASELAVHPSDGRFVQQQNGDSVLGVVLYLMCDDVQQTVKWLEAQKVQCTAIEQAPWGRFTLVTLPSGGKIGLYQPSHPTALDLR
jgi:hypothetical protein